MQKILLNLLETDIFKCNIINKYIKNDINIIWYSTFFYFEIYIYINLCLNMIKVCSNLNYFLIRNLLFFFNIDNLKINFSIINIYQEFLYNLFYIKRKNNFIILKNTKNISIKINIFKEILQIKRISKTNKKGRISRFSVLLLIGNYSGWLGIGKAKSSDILKATRYAYLSCSKNINYFKISKINSIFGEYLFKSKNFSFYLKPLRFSVGLICCNFIKKLLRITGYLNVWGKIIGKINLEILCFMIIEELKTKELHKKFIQQNIYFNNRDLINICSKVI